MFLRSVTMFLATAFNTKHRNDHSGRPIAKKPGDHLLVDLKLDQRLEPVSVSDYKRTAPNPFCSQRLASSLVDGETYAIGSGHTDDHIYYPGDLGLFGCVFEAWKNHWVLRTRPEDWWGPIACKIAKAVDETAKRKGKDANQVRDLFVSHKGKENIQVAVPCYTIYDADYDSLFSEFSSQIEGKIKVPEYAQAMQNDFESSGPAHKIASQINLMASMQQFFSYEMVCFGCGLRGLEMAGSVEDWESLVTKLEQVRKTLKPINNQICLYDGWWDNVLGVFQNLANTRKNPNDPAVAKFWINILMDTTGTKYVGGGGSMPGRPVEVEAYDGWLVSFLTNQQKILAEDLKLGGRKRVKEQLSGWNTVPMKVSLVWCNPPVDDESTLVAGIVGFKLHKGGEDGSMKQSEEKEEIGELVPSVEPNYMWAMLLSPGSKLRGLP